MSKFTKWPKKVPLNKKNKLAILEATLVLRLWPSHWLTDGAELLVVGAFPTSIFSMILSLPAPCPICQPPRSPPSCQTCHCYAIYVCWPGQTGMTVGKWMKVNIEYPPPSLVDKKSDKAPLILLHRTVKVAEPDFLSPQTTLLTSFTSQTFIIVVMISSH